MTSDLIKGSEARRYDRDGRYVHTQAGRFYAADPLWNVEAMAHALAQQVRFSGNAQWRYSVAEHSVLVSLLVEDMGGTFLEQMEALLHDGTESVLSDVASPWKADLPDYKRLEREFDSTLRSKFGLPDKQADVVTKADWLALFIEAAVLMPEHGQDFTDPNRLRPVALRYLEQGWTPSTLDDDWRAARTMFLQRYTYLKERLSGKNERAARKEAKARAQV